MYGVVGVVALAAVAVAVMRIRQLNAAAVPAPRERGAARNFKLHTDPEGEVEIAAYPSFAPLPFVAPTTAPTRPLGDEWALPLGTRIVLRDEDDRRLVVAVRPAPQGISGEQEVVKRVLADVVREVGMRKTEELGERPLGERAGSHFLYEAASHVGTVTIGVRGERVIVLFCTGPHKWEYESGRRPFERTMESVKLK